MKILVTGADGFVGAYLCGALLGRGHEIIPVVRYPAEDLLVRTAEAPETASSTGLVPVAIDLPDDLGMRRAVEEHAPDAVAHLAALSTIPDSESLPRIAHDVNVLGTESVVQALAETELPAPLLLVSSCIVYGPTPVEDQPVTELTRPRPNTVYGETKLESEERVRRAVHRLAAPPVIVRPFNHFGPGQPPTFVLSSFARQISRIGAGLEPAVLRVGNLSVRREFLDVRDVVEAYVTILETSPANDLYTIASGRPVVLRELVESMGRLAETEFEIVPDPRRMRPNDLEVLYGDSSRLHRDTGWQTRYSTETSLRDLLAYWHDAVRTDAGRRS